MCISVLLTACGGGGGDAPTEGTGATQSPAGRAGSTQPAAGERSRDERASCTPSGSNLSIAARNVEFDKDCLAAPAGEAFTIEFNNTEAVPHNVAILPEHDASNALFRGEVFSGPRTRTYQVPAMEAGNYHFHCDVHPEMQGGFIVQ